MLGVLRCSEQSCTEKESSCVIRDFQISFWTLTTGERLVCNHCNLEPDSVLDLRQSIFYVRNFPGTQLLCKLRENCTLFCSNIHPPGSSGPVQQHRTSSSGPVSTCRAPIHANSARQSDHLTPSQCPLPELCPNVYILKHLLYKMHFPFFYILQLGHYADF